MDFFQFVASDNYYGKIDAMGQWRMMVCLWGHLSLVMGGRILAKTSQI